MLQFALEYVFIDFTIQSRGGEREIEIDSKIHWRPGKEGLLGSSLGRALWPCPAVRSHGSGCKKPWHWFLRKSDPAPHSISLPPCLLLSVSFSLCPVWEQVGRCGPGERLSKEEWRDVGEDRGWEVWFLPGLTWLAFPTLGWPCLSPGPQHLSVAHLPAVTLA